MYLPPADLKIVPQPLVDCALDPYIENTAERRGRSSFIHVGSDFHIQRPFPHRAEQGAGAA